MTVKELRSLMEKAWEDGFLAASVKPNREGQLSGVTMDEKSSRRRDDFVRDNMAALVDDQVL
jgi:hypothetical protein